MAVAAGTEGFTGATQLSFTVGALPFVDVNETNAAYAAIKTLYQNGIVQGNGAGRFYPDDLIQDAHWQLILERLAGPGCSWPILPQPTG